MQNLAEASQSLTAILQAEIERRCSLPGADREEVLEAVLREMTPPGWRYRTYRHRGPGEPEFHILPAAFMG